MTEPTTTAEPRYQRVSEVAAELSLSSDTIIRLFENEPDVLKLQSKPSRYKRRKRTLLIPPEAKARVINRLSNGA